MSMPVIRREVAMMLAQVNGQIAEEEAKFASETDSEKVAGAGELAFLRHQHEMLEQRLKEIEDNPNATETLFQWIKEECFGLSLRLDTWIAGGR
jgi:hypothetical protein